MPSSSIGFGYQPWGNYPWGHSDWAEEVLWKGMPSFYHDLDRQSQGLVPNPLRGFISAIKPMFEEIRAKFREFPELWDADECPEFLLASLTRNIGLPSFDDKPAIFQRTAALNAVQLYIHKGTDKGYDIIASFEGLSVDVVGLWAETCEPGAFLSENPPAFFLANMDEVPADVIHADTFYTNRFAIWPYPLTNSVNPPGTLFLDAVPLDALPLDSGLSVSDGRCRSHSIRLNFYNGDDTEIEDFENVSSRITILVDFMKPMHVELDQVTFDGPKSSSTWTSMINADNPASATFTASINGAVEASSTWTAEISADLET